jgi:phosphoribosyl 1,2-cyclic phosphate phosphodiesterase
MGIDDLRAFNYLSGNRLPAYGNAETMNTLSARCPYIFSKKPDKVFYGASLEAHALPEVATGEVVINDIPVTYFDQIHAKIKTLGYRIGSFAYSTDLNALPETAFDALEGVEVWLVDCLRYTESYSHSHLSQTLEWIAKVNPRLAILTHMSHEFEYDRLSNELPSGVVAAYDGMLIEL